MLTQTYGDFELLIWDDGSTDNSLNIANDYAKLDKRVRIVAAQHLGRTPTLIAAHAQCLGNYLGWVDSDDALASTALSETVAILNARPEVGLVYTDYLAIDLNNYITGYGQRCRIPYSKERLLIDFMTFHFRLFRREVFEAAGGIDADFERAPDYDLCLRLSEITQVLHLEKPLYYYRNHTDNISHQHRIEQILWSKEAINRALRRRGLADSYQVDVEIVGRFSLRPMKTS